MFSLNFTSLLSRVVYEHHFLISSSFKLADSLFFFFQQIFRTSSCILLKVNHTLLVFFLIILMRNTWAENFQMKKKIIKKIHPGKTNANQGFLRIVTCSSFFFFHPYFILFLSFHSPLSPFFFFFFFPQQELTKANEHPFLLPAQAFSQITRSIWCNVTWVEAAESFP